jgi:hypothetical protein
MEIAQLPNHLSYPLHLHKPYSILNFRKNHQVQKKLQLWQKLLWSRPSEAPQLNLVYLAIKNTSEYTKCTLAQLANNKSERKCLIRILQSYKP